MSLETGEILVLLVAAGSWTIFLSAVWLYLGWQARKFVAQVGKTLTAVGFEKLAPDKYGFTFKGRKFMARLSPRKRARRGTTSPKLEIQIAGPFNTQLAVALPKMVAYSAFRGWVPALIHEMPRKLTPEGYFGYAVYAAEPVSASQLLAQPAARQVLVALLNNFGLQQVAVSIFPHKLVFQVREFDPQLLTPDLVWRWLAGLDELATLAQNLPPLRPELLDEGLQVARQQFRSRQLVIVLLLSGLLFLATLRTFLLRIR